MLALHCHGWFSLADASSHAAAVPAAAAPAVGALRGRGSAPVAVRGQRRASSLLKGGGAGLQPVHKAEPLLHLARGIQTCTGQQPVFKQLVEASMLQAFMSSLILRKCVLLYCGFQSAISNKRIPQPDGEVRQQLTAPHCAERGALDSSYSTYWVQLPRYRPECTSEAGKPRVRPGKTLLHMH